MTTITIKKDDNGRTDYKLSGHAGDSSICAGISALLFAAVDYASRHPQTMEYTAWDNGDGEATLAIVPIDGGEGAVQFLTELLEGAWEHIARENPKNLQIWRDLGGK